jgi:hypothetical protein
MQEQIYQIFEFVAVSGLSRAERCRLPVPARVVRGTAARYNRNP